MHLCLVSNEYPPATHGGIGSTNQTLAEGMVRAGHVVTVVGVYSKAELRRIGAPSSEKKSSLRIYRLSATDGRHFWHQRVLWDRWRLKRFILQLHRRERFDVVECADYGGWLPWGGPKSVPTIVRLQGTNFLQDHELGWRGDPFEYRLERLTLRNASHWIGCSEFVIRRTREVSGIATKPGCAIPTAVDTDLFKPDPSVPVEEGLIVFVNSIGPRKGVPELMDAVNMLFPNHPTAHLVLVGGEVGKPVNGVPYIEQMKAKLLPNVARRVKFLGRLDRRTEIVPLLQKAHVCCYPSHFETLGLGPIEAMACGKPVLYSTCGPGQEVIEDKISGLLCDPKNPRDIAAKLAQLLIDKQLANRLGQAARQRALNLFSQSNWILRNVAFFEKCVKDGKT